jgi:hypothetical protein
MTAENDTDRYVATVLDGGQDGMGSPPPWRGGASGLGVAPTRGGPTPPERQGSAVAQDSGQAPVPAPDTAADPWPGWARPQLLDAVALAGPVSGRPGRPALATELYRGWYSPVLAPAVELGRPGRPLAGIYRAAHAGSGSRILADGIALVDRHDAVGRDGWWRTWGDAWVPVDSRRGCVRVLLSPRPSLLAEFVGTVTAALLVSREPWLLACATDPRRLSRSGSAVLHVPDAAVLPADLFSLLRPLLLPVAPPLCLPLASGAALAASPGKSASFGALRCHLIALALQRSAERPAPLAAIADVFAAHGINPATPHLTNPR